MNASANQSGEGGPPARRRRQQEQTPLQRALGLLTRREHSRKELSSKLASRGVAQEDADAAVEKLAGDGWQSDQRFAEFLLRSRVAGGYGPLRIRAELAMHGLDRDAIAAAMESFDGDWTETACDLVRRRFGPGSLVDAGQRRKAADLLTRRGFDGDSIRAALHGVAED